MCKKDLMSVPLSLRALSFNFFSSLRTICKKGLSHNVVVELLLLSFLLLTAFELLRLLLVARGYRRESKAKEVTTCVCGLSLKEGNKADKSLVKPNSLFLVCKQDLLKIFFLPLLKASHSRTKNKQFYKSRKFDFLLSKEKGHLFLLCNK